MVDVIHADQLRQHGGSGGVRDNGLIESALARPRNRYLYESDADLLDLGAAYAIGLAKNHGFIDGNKRVAFMAVYVFLGLNGLRLVASETEAVRVMTDIAAGAMSEAALARWLRQNTRSRE